MKYVDSVLFDVRHQKQNVKARLYLKFAPVLSWELLVSIIVANNRLKLIMCELSSFFHQTCKWKFPVRYQLPSESSSLDNMAQGRFSAIMVDM